MVFVVAVGSAYVQPAQLDGHSRRRSGSCPQERSCPELVQEATRPGRRRPRRVGQADEAGWRPAYRARVGRSRKPSGCERPAGYRPKSRGDDGRVAEKRAPRPAADRAQIGAVVEKLLPKVRTKARPEKSGRSGACSACWPERWLLPIDDATRTPFMPYGLSGIMLGAAIVFFAYIGFDSISTHAEEARNPQRDVPIGILISLLLCTILYMAVAAVITGMVPYPEIDMKAPIAVAFARQAAIEHSPALGGHRADLPPAVWPA